MKRLAILLVVCIVMCGCGGQEDALSCGLSLREKMLSHGCSFTAEITADYGDKTYAFSMGCTADTDGTLKFIVTAPESIAGISGTITKDAGYLTFDDAALAFPLLADGEASPVSAPWILVNTLRSGYLSSAGMEDSCIRLTIHDSYEEDALQLDIWLDEDEVPIQSDIIWQGRRVLSVTVKDFTFV